MGADFSSIFETEQYLFFERETASSTALRLSCAANRVGELDMGEDARRGFGLRGVGGDAKAGEVLALLLEDVDDVDGGAGAERHQDDLHGAGSVGVSRVAIDSDGFAVFCRALKNLVVLPIAVRDQESVPPVVRRFHYRAFRRKFSRRMLLVNERLSESDLREVG